MPIISAFFGIIIRMFYSVDRLIHAISVDY